MSMTDEEVEELKDGGTFKGIIQINGLKRSELLFKVPGEFLE